MSKMRFKDILSPKDGITKGPFGGDIKKAYFVPKGDNTYKVYEQSVVYDKNINYGSYYIDKERYEKLKKFSVKTGDLLLTGAGTLGELFEVPEKHEQGVINQALLRIRLNENIIDKEFFKFYFKWYIKDVVCRINGDSVIPNLPPIALLKETEIEIPDIILQKKIAKVLIELENKIFNNNKINAELESMAKTLYDYWFLQFEFPNEEGKPYKSSGGKMVWNEELKREIPKGWTYCQLAMISKIKAGGDKDSDTQDTFDAEHSVPVYANGGENKGLYGYTKVATVCKPCVTVAARGTIGLTFLRMEPFMPIIRLICVIPNDIEYVKFLEISLNSIEYKKDGSIQQQLTIPQLSDYKFIIPKIEIMRKFHKLTMDFQRKIIEIEKENQELALLRDFLLPMLMNGQVGFKEE